MKAYSLLLALIGILAATLGWAQPATNNFDITLDIDGHEQNAVGYELYATGRFGNLYESWDVGVSLRNLGELKFLRATPNHVAFQAGENVDETRGIYQRIVQNLPPKPPSVRYSMVVMDYRAETYRPDLPDQWTYQALQTFPTFEGQTEVLLGLRLVIDGVVHYGWVRLSRPVADIHTVFEITGHDWNPVPGAAIGAGEPPPPPPLQGTVGEDGLLTFQWDTSLGEMVLEWTDHLAEPMHWQPVPDSAWPPVQLPLDEAGQHFFRLRRP